MVERSPNPPRNIYPPLDEVRGDHERWLSAVETTSSQNRNDYQWRLSSVETTSRHLSAFGGGSG